MPSSWFNNFEAIVWIQRNSPKAKTTHASTHTNTWVGGISWSPHVRRSIHWCGSAGVWVYGMQQVVWLSLKSMHTQGKFLSRRRNIATKTDTYRDKCLRSWFLIMDAILAHFLRIEWTNCSKFFTDKCPEYLTFFSGYTFSWHFIFLSFARSATSSYTKRRKPSVKRGKWIWQLSARGTFAIAQKVREHTFWQLNWLFWWGNRQEVLSKRKILKMFIIKAKY